MNQPFFEIRLYSKAAAGHEFRFSDDYDAMYAAYDAFSLIPEDVARQAGRVELRATTVPNNFSLGQSLAEIDNGLDVEVISTGVYVIIVGPSLEPVRLAWARWMDGVRWLASADR